MISLVSAAEDHRLSALRSYPLSQTRRSMSFNAPRLGVANVYTVLLPGMSAEFRGDITRSTGSRICHSEEHLKVLTDFSVA